MKKIMLGVMVVASLALVSACKSQPKPAPSNPPAEQSTEDAFKAVYTQYAGDLITADAKKYTVVKGDELVKIARNFYHDGYDYPIIMLASNQVVLDPDKIEPGMELTVPDLEKNLADPTARANIKSFLLEIAKIEEQRNRHETADGLRKRSDSL